MSTFLLTVLLFTLVYALSISRRNRPDRHCAARVTGRQIPIKNIRRKAHPRTDC